MNFKEAALAAIQKERRDDARAWVEAIEKARQAARDEAEKLAITFHKTFGFKPEPFVIKSKDQAKFIAAVAVPDTLSEFVTLVGEAWFPVYDHNAGEAYVFTDCDGMTTLADFGSRYFEDVSQIV